MEIGVIGINQFAKALCRHWITQGHNILFADLNIYAKSYAMAEAMGVNVRLSLPEKAASECEVLVVAVAREKLALTIPAIGKVSQKIVIDLVMDNNENDLRAPSSFRVLRDSFPDAKIVKLTSLYPLHVVHPDALNANVLYSYTNDQLAQRMVRKCVEGSEFKLIDLVTPQN